MLKTKKNISKLILFLNIDGLVGWFMVFNATFNNLSVISWRLVYLVEEIGEPVENHRPVANFIT
jgi:hypothetical protein